MVAFTVISHFSTFLVKLSRYIWWFLQISFLNVSSQGMEYHWWLGAYFPRSHTCCVCSYPASRDIHADTDLLSGWDSQAVVIRLHGLSVQVSANGHYHQV